MYKGAIVALSLLMLSGVAYAKRTITVTGIGTASYKPTTAQFYLNTSSTKPTNAASSSANAATVQQLKGKLQQLGLKTSQIRLGYANSRPNYQRDANGRSTPQIESWTTNQQVTVKVPFKGANNLVGKVYSTATGVDSVQISGPSADISQTTIRNAEAKARSRAVTNAVREAKNQLQASGVARLGKLLKVEPVGQSGGVYYPATRSMALESAQATPEFSSPEKQTVTQTVNATFKIKSKGLLGRLGF
jgi:uncharacterized protein YggE